MASQWKDYQQAAADFFRKLGLKATLEHKVEGARASHKIDVYVEGSYLGINFKWIIECKAWRKNVPKEKVMALAAIVQDVGADRGILLSEKGFQSGAIRAANKSNVTLTSLGDLSAATEEQFLDAIIGRLHWRYSKAKDRLYQIKREKFPDEFLPPTIRPLGKIMYLELGFPDALKGDYPIIYCVEDGIRHKANSLEEFVREADALISEAEKWMPPTE